MIRLRSARALIFATAFLAPIRAWHAQGPAVQQSSRAATSMYFTADDALEINTYAIADVSDDGRWVALTQAVRRDSYGTDYRHDGDPTYVHPSPVRLWSLDSRTGERRAVFADKRAVRGMRWSPDGNQLAMLVWSGDVYEPAIWDRPMVVT